MNVHELKEQVFGGESERVEFKRSTGQRTDAAKMACAMLNGLGGFVLFGVTDSGDMVGQQVSAKTLEDMAAVLRRIEPPTFPDIQTISLKKGVSVIVVTVSGGGGPYTYDGRVYLRHGSTTAVMPRDEYERRLVERLHATRRWENEPVAEGVSIEDLDAEEIRITLDNAIRLGRLEATNQRDTASILRGLELMHEGKLLNAAVALYGKSGRLKVLYPQMGIRLARFRGKNRLADFADNRQYWDHAFALLRRAESFLMDHVPIAGRVVPGKMIREDQPWYPPRATREALAKPHESKPWNPIIANVFYRAGIIERWGTGTLNIIDWCAENANPAPAWQEQAGSVYVTFLPAVLPDIPEVTPQVTPQVAPQVAPQVIRLLNVLEEGELNRGLLMEKLGLHDRKSFRKNYLQPMLEQNLIEMTLPDSPKSPTQKYRLTGKGREVVKDEGGRWKDE